jgi:acetyltransferase-like isoleucine patch superfamily enzyme
MINIHDTGYENIIQISNNYDIADINIRVTGNDNKLFLSSPLDVLKSSVLNINISGDNNHIDIGSVFFNRLDCEFKDGIVFFIGDQTSINYLTVTSNEPSSIRIGSNCLFAFNISIYGTDFHKILKNGKRINHPKPIIIEDKVWCCNDVKILNGTIIKNGSIIGAGAVVKGCIEAKSIAVGNPARIVNRDIEWEP